jgi:alpha-methylacyl-CoA racemase
MKPLNGIRVLDMSRLLPGPMCSWYLVGLGADVSKIESPDGADYLRFMPPLRSDGQGAWFSALHAGKESIALNLKLPIHVEAMNALLAEADVLIESSRPGVMGRLGLAPERLREQFPRLVIVSITGFGQTGPMRNRPGHDLGFQALAGTLSLSARSKGVPDVPGIPVADVAGGALTGALRICAALFERERTGKGVWIDVSMTEGAMAMMAPIVAGVAVTGKRPEPGGEILTGGSPRYRVYRCRGGGLLSVSPLEPKFWMNLCTVTGEDLADDAEQLAAVFATKTRDEWSVLLGDACCEPVLELDELGEFGHHRSRGAVSGSGEDLRVSQPFPGGADSAQLPSPELGEHTESALHRVGFDSSRLKGS